MAITATMATHPGSFSRAVNPALGATTRGLTSAHAAATSCYPAG